MIKVDVISGFLGAGKTTLIKKLLKGKLKDEKVVLIENEFGEIGIDGSFLKDSGIEIKEINSGCICCSLVGDFSSSMKEIVDKFSPERIIIEPSGVGKLSDIVRAIEKVEEDLKINVIATVVDGGKAKMYHKNFGEFYNDQVKEAHTVIVSKTENLSEEKLIDTVNIIKELNPSATVITTPVEELDADKLIETLENKADLAVDLLNEIKKNKTDDECCHHHHHDDEDDDDEECECHHHEHHHDDDDDECNHEHHHEHHHEHNHDDDDDECHHEHHHGHHHHGHDADEVFTSWGKETPVGYSKAELEFILKSLSDETSPFGVILRAKGIVRAKDNEKWYYFDLVAGEYEIRLGEPDYTGRLCVIGSKIDEEKLENLFFKG